MSLLKVILCGLRELFAAVGLAYTLIAALLHHYTGHWWPFS